MLKFNCERTSWGLHMLLDMRKPLGSRNPKLEISWLIMEQNKRDAAASAHFPLGDRA